MDSGATFDKVAVLTASAAANGATLVVFPEACVMGASVREIDRTYGHLARDSEDAIRDRLEARADRLGEDSASARSGK